jgi:transcriptional regulator with XRE-family HTH domain
MDAGSIGARIREERKAKDVSQATLARLCGVKPVSAWRWETGRIVPSLRRLQAVADVLGIHLSRLVVGDS